MHDPAGRKSLAPLPANRRVSARRPRRYRYYRVHTPHFYLVTAALVSAGVVCAVSIAALVSRSDLLSELSFWAAVGATLVVCSAYFWGFYMIMSGHIPMHRLKIFLPHACAGTLIPALYMLNIAAALSRPAAGRIDGLSVAVASVSFLLICVQYAMGRAVVRPERLRILSSDR